VHPRRIGPISQLTLAARRPVFNRRFAEGAELGMNTPRSPDSTGEHDAVENELSEPVLSGIREALRGLRFGQVRIEIQNGLVVLVERFERRRVVRFPDRATS
jgi:hypothetical protein